jgi:hypothetical protein
MKIIVCSAEGVPVPICDRLGMQRLEYNWGNVGYQIIVMERTFVVTCAHVVLY